MEITIILTVSRFDFLQRVVSSIELQDITARNVGILAIVDGTEELYLQTRNLLNETKFAENLTVMFEGANGVVPRYDINARRQRIAQIHNQAKQLISDTTQYVFTVEDDTILPRGAVKTLLNVAAHKKSIGQVTGVELGRWSVPYVGAWVADDVYEPTQLRSLPNATDYPTAFENIDACGLYCSLIQASLYKAHNFTSANGLGPDVNLGIELRQLGYENFIHWGVHCTHMTTDNGEEQYINATDKSKIIVLTKLNEQKWTQEVLET